MKSSAWFASSWPLAPASSLCENHESSSFPLVMGEVQDGGADGTVTGKALFILTLLDATRTAAKLAWISCGLRISSNTK